MQEQTIKVKTNQEDSQYTDAIKSAANSMISQELSARDSIDNNLYTGSVSVDPAFHGDSIESGYNEVRKYGTYDDFLQMMRQREKFATGTFSPEEVYKNDWMNLICEKALAIVSKAEIAMYKSRQVTFKQG